MTRPDDAERRFSDAASLAGLVRAWRERVPLTQEELAQRAGLSVGTIRGLEAGRIRRPRSRSLRQLAQALGLDDDDSKKLVVTALGAGGAGEAGGEAADGGGDTWVSPSQLPPAVADFTGRERQVAWLEETLRAGGHGSGRAVAISALQGRGGVGKTTLAVHVAHRLTDTFADGQLYLNLRGAQADPVDPAHALARLLRALGVSESVIPDDLDERAELYRSRIAGRRCLVVLDNAASEAQVRPLLPGTPSSAVLVTSRRRLTGLEGTRLIDLDVFEPEHATELLARIAGAERIAAEPVAAREVAELCGHLPLAVRIAGARLAARPHWRIAQLVERLADERRRLDELVVGDLEVRASIGLSYMSLGNDARRAFRLLGLLDAPDIANWVVAALLDCRIEKASDDIEELVAAHLVEVADTDATGAVRYRLHDLVRLYARERASDEETDGDRRAALVRALGAWLALAEQADDQMPSRYFARVRGGAPRWHPDDQTTSSHVRDPMAWFEAERAALVAAVTQACALELAELAWELAESVHVFLEWRSFLDDWELTHMRALALCRQAGNTLGRAVMARSLTDLCEQRGRDRLISCADDAIAASREVGHRELEAESLVQWGVLHRHDDPAAARVRIEAGRLLAARAGYLLGSLSADLWLGVMHYEAGQHDAAARRAELVLALAREHGDRGGQFQGLRLLGVSCRELGLYQQSEESFRQALDIIQAIGNRTEETRVLAGLGELYIRRGRADEARSTLERSLRLAAEIGDGFGKAVARRALGELDLAEHRYETALAQLQVALEAYRQIGLTHLEARTLRALGDAQAGLGDSASARSAWELAQSLYERLGNTPEVDTLRERLASVDHVS